jgi:hypothetical protein
MINTNINDMLPEHPALLNPDVDIDEAVCDLPCLKSIWDCPQMNKAVVPSAGGNHVAGWTCGWCPGGGHSKVIMQ